MKKINTKMKIGLIIIAVLILISILAPYIATHDPVSNDLPNRLLPPGHGWIFGTDNLGRDVFSRMLYGSRYSIWISVLILAISLTVGVILGLIAGYYRGVMDGIIMTVVEILLAFPSMILSLAVAGIMGAGMFNAIIAVCVVSWIGYTRLVRAMVITIKEREFVKAAILDGCSDFKIIFRHILPNVMTSVIVYAATNISNIIMQIASLSFLGLGVQLPIAEWGNMLNEAKGFITTAPWLIIIPGVALILLITGFNLFGEGLTEFLNEEKAGSVYNG